MTPKEERFWAETVVRVAQAAYTIGHEDGAARKSLNIKQFQLSKEALLLLKTELTKATQNR